MFELIHRRSRGGGGARSRQKLQNFLGLIQGRGKLLVHPRARSHKFWGLNLGGKMQMHPLLGEKSFLLGEEGAGG